MNRVTIEANKIYNFKTEFWPSVGINKGQWENRREDLLEWISNFYEYELLDGRPIRIHIKEVIGEYQPLPRKMNNRVLTEQKKEDYKNFAIAALGTEFKPNSKRRVAKQGIAAFGKVRYGHISIPAVAERYIGPVFDEYGETDNQKKWVWYSTYEPLDSEALLRWRRIMEEEHIAESEAANAFYRYADGEDISEEIGYFKKARDRFVEEFGEYAVLVPSWRLKKGAD